MDKWLAGIAAGIIITVVGGLILHYLTVDQQPIASSPPPVTESSTDKEVGLEDNVRQDEESRTEEDPDKNVDSSLSTSPDLERNNLALTDECVIRETSFEIYDNGAIYNSSSDNLAGRKQSPSARMCAFDMSISGESLCVALNGQVFAVEPSGAVQVGVCRPV